MSSPPATQYGPWYTKDNQQCRILYEWIDNNYQAVREECEPAPLTSTIDWLMLLLGLAYVSLLGLSMYQSYDWD